MLCLRCQKPMDRVDAGTMAEIFSPGVYYAVGERIGWCRDCRLYLRQNVEIRIRDDGETSDRHVRGKTTARGEGIR